MAISKLALAKLTALSESTRMSIVLHLAAQKESMPISTLASSVGIDFTNTSHHVGVLERSGLIIKDKAGRSVIVSLNPEIWNSSNKEDTCGYFAFDGFKLALPGLSAVASAAKAAKAKPKAEKEKPAPAKKKAAPKPEVVDDEDDDDDDSDE